jgi:hypothetical protein
MTKHNLFLKLTLGCLLALSVTQVFAQEFYLPLGKEANLKYEPYLNHPGSKMHTAVKPYMLSEVKSDTPFDSLYQLRSKPTAFTGKWIGRKLLNEHLLNISTRDFTLFADPVFDLSLGNESESGSKTWVNTRGYNIHGRVGKQVHFYSNFYENQAEFTGYLQQYMERTRIIPGQGRFKRFRETGYDYAMASGGVIFKPSRYFAFQFAHDKNFIGDGYRSLLLSDNAFNYPFLKVTTSVWKLKYMNLYTQFQDIGSPHDPDVGFRKKYGTFHYLSFNTEKRFSIGLFETVIWKQDSAGARGFDINYLNPVIFYRPVEFSVGSPDNVMMGMTLKYLPFKNHVFFGQLLLDEFLLDEVREGRGWWGNKQAFQAGYKIFNLFTPNLHLAGEFNFVRPFTYQHRTNLQNFGHYNQPLAHPAGANFHETILAGSYAWKRWYVQARMNLIKAGEDTAKLNFGGDIFRTYESRVSEYNNYLLQGLKTETTHNEFRAGYLVNPSWNFVAEAGLSTREKKSAAGSDRYTMIQIGIRTNLSNRYYDF